MAKLSLKRNKKLGVIYHPDTNLIIRSAKDKVIVGRIVDGEVKLLDEEDIKLCQEWDFEYDEDKVKNREEEEEEGQEDDEEEAESEEVEEEEEVEEDDNVSEKRSEKTEKTENENNQPQEPQSNSSVQLTSVVQGVILDFVQKLQKLGVVEAEQNENKERVAELEGELKKVQNELEHTKKKLEQIREMFSG